MYERPFVTTLSDRLRESRRFIQVVIGPRQTGKSTGVSQALGKLSAPVVEYAFDRPRDRRSAKLEEIWGQAREMLGSSPRSHSLAGRDTESSGLVLNREVSLG